ncbi:MAG: single-stranded-DNA-specific exonuclease RecJ [Planctomycetes bacterium]|nr:single-stranded-DNA-specific exonuclease RecJ [Planctomycetota bacterium]MCA8937364.1 single-stranded-DNA-specific exonuclease RecJ [Planctomycetota bacterium]
MPTTDVEAAWCVASQRSAHVRELASGLRIPEFVARALINRGVRDPETAGLFLKPSSTQLEDPFAFRHMERAVERTLHAVKQGEKILIQGDYDVDGSASAALLVNLFRLLGSDVDVSIPSRAEEGYGLNERIIRDAAKSGVKLLITCDNGTTANEEIALANQLGIDTIVTDHHTVGETLPEAFAIMNPHIAEETVQFRELCGAGVAFKFGWALLQRSSSGEALDIAFKDFLAGAQSLVALASIADVVPLTGENRVLTSFGLKLMPDSPNPGIRALMELAGLDHIPTGTDVGFKLAPRLNAGGRLGRESLAVELLTARSYGEAMDIAREMDTLNRERQSVDRALTKLAEEMVQSDVTYESDRILVLGHDEFHPGVVGIVAARMTRRFNKPAVLVAMRGETGRGSGRSIPGFHLYNALNECSDLMERFGGHAQAAGLEITREKLGVLRRAVNEVADKHILQADYATPTLDIDAGVRLSEMNVAGVRVLEALEPFGQGNTEPVFMADEIEVVAPPRVVGRGTGHLSLMVRQLGSGRFEATGPRNLFDEPARKLEPSSTFKAIAFGMGARVSEINRGDKIRIVFTPKISTFRGPPVVELEIKDFRA